MWTTAPWFALHGAGWRDPAADQPSAQALILQIEKLWSGDRNPSSPRWSVGRCAPHWPAVPASHRAHFLLTPLSVAGALWGCSAPLLLQDPGFPAIVAEGTGAPGGSHRVTSQLIGWKPTPKRPEMPSHACPEGGGGGGLGTAQMSLQPGHLELDRAPSAARAPARRSPQFCK